MSSQDANDVFLPLEFYSLYAKIKCNHRMSIRFTFTEDTRNELLGIGDVVH